MSGPTPKKRPETAPSRWSSTWVLAGVFVVGLVVIVLGVVVLLHLANHSARTTPLIVHGRAVEAGRCPSGGTSCSSAGVLGEVSARSATGSVLASTPTGVDGRFTLVVPAKGVSVSFVSANQGLVCSTPAATSLSSGSVAITCHPAV